MNPSLSGVLDQAYVETYSMAALQEQRRADPEPPSC